MAEEWSVNVVLNRTRCPYRQWNDSTYICTFEPSKDGSTFYRCVHSRCRLKVI